MSSKSRRPFDQNSDDLSQRWEETDFSGIAGVDLLSLASGWADGAIRASAAAAGTLYRSGAANGTAGYDILLEFKGTGWNADLQVAFKNAADYFTTVITGDIGNTMLYRGKIVDDVYITAEVKNIDGAGGILGQAGPLAIRTANELTVAGMMEFDVADAATYLAEGLWQAIVTHEMMHVLGFGTLWNYGANPLQSGEQYTGAAGLAAYREATGNPSAAFIPVETDGGSGTAFGHWDETALNNELMTGFINTDNNPATTNDNYLSEFSVMSLADLGYQVAYQDYPYDGTTIV